MLTIKVEASPGSRIEDAFDQATELAKKLQCYVEFQFNDVTCCANPSGSKERGAERYYAESARKDGYFKYAINF